MKVAEALGHRIKWDHVAFESLPYDVQTTFIRKCNLYQLSRRMKNAYWFQEEYINIFKWKYLDKWTPPGSPRLMELFKDYICLLYTSRCV